MTSAELLIVYDSGTPMLSRQHIATATTGGSSTPTYTPSTTTMFSSCSGPLLMSGGVHGRGCGWAGS